MMDEYNSQWTEKQQHAFSLICMLLLYQTLKSKWVEQLLLEV